MTKVDSEVAGNSKHYVFNCPATSLKAVDAVAKERGWSRSQTIRLFLVWYLDKQPAVPVPPLPSTWEPSRIPVVITKRMRDELETMAQVKGWSVAKVLQAALLGAFKKWAASLP